MARDTGGAKKSLDETQSEWERWRRAAEDALEQLAWTTGYLHGIGKRAEARMLATNRRMIRERVLDRSAQPLPTNGVRASADGPAQR